MVGVTRIHTGEIWLAQLDPVVGHEQGGRRPVVVISSNGFHALPIDMVVVVLLTSHDRGLVTQPRISNPRSGPSRAVATGPPGSSPQSTTGGLYHRPEPPPPPPAPAPPFPRALRTWVPSTKTACNADLARSAAVNSPKSAR